MAEPKKIKLKKAKQPEAEQPPQPKTKWDHKVVIPASARSSHHHNPPHLGTRRKAKNTGKVVAMWVFGGLLVGGLLFALFKYSQEKRYEARAEFLALTAARQHAYELCKQMDPEIVAMEKLLTTAEERLAIVKEAVVFVTGQPLRAKPAPTAQASPAPTRARGASQPAPATARPSPPPAAPRRDVGHEVMDDRDAPAGIMSRAELEAMRNRKSEENKAPRPAPEPAPVPAAPPEPVPPAPRPAVAVEHEVVVLGRQILERVELIRSKIDETRGEKFQADDLLEEAYLAPYSTGAAAKGQEIAKLLVSAQNQVGVIRAIVEDISDATDRVLAVRERVTTERAAQAEAERQRRLAEEHEALVAKEKERAVELRNNVVPLVKQYDFTQAVNDIEYAMRSYRTDEGKAVLSIVLDRLVRLQNMKTTLIEQINAAPLSWGWVVGPSPKDVLSADPTGLTITGNERVNWQDVPLPQMLKLLSHYADLTETKLSTRADLYLAIAILLHDLDQEDASQDYRRKALRAAAYLREEADRLLPQ